MTSRLVCTRAVCCARCVCTPVTPAHAHVTHAVTTSIHGRSASTASQARRHAANTNTDTTTKTKSTTTATTIVAAVAVMFVVDNAGDNTSCR